MSWEMGIAPPGMAPPGFGEAYPPPPPGMGAYPDQAPVPPGPPTPQDAWGGPPPPMPPPGDYSGAQPGMYPPGPGPVTSFPDPSATVYGAGAQPPSAPGLGWPPAQSPAAYPPAPPGVGGYGGVPSAGPPPPQWQAQGMGAPSISVGDGASLYGDRGKYSRRKALLIGISYSNSIRPLGGCINDVRNISQFIVERYGFPKDTMVILTDEPGQDQAHIPTKANMLRWMRWLVADARPGDSLFLHFSGHGSQTPDTSVDGDEIDAMDETILPVDYESAGQIVDDDLHDILVKNLPAGVRLTAIFDSCHSGTALDLPYVYDDRGKVICSPEMMASAGSASVAQSYSKPTQASTSYTSSYGTPYTTTSYTLAPSGGVSYSAPTPQSNAVLQYHMHKRKKFGRMLGHMFGFSQYRDVGADDGGDTSREYSYQAHMKKISQADVIMFAGCSDEQTSADTSIQGVGRTGAMSYAFIASLRSNPRGLTYSSLLGQMREVLRSQAFGQVPQLSASHPMDMGRAFTL